MKNKISAILINYNNGKDVIKSSKKLLSYGDIDNVIIVDNGSTDGSLKKIRQGKNSKTLFIYNGENLGFAKAANRGIKLALELGSKYIVILNPDLELYKNFATNLIKNGADLVQMALKFRRGDRWIYDYGGKVNWYLGKTYHYEKESPDSQFEGSPDYVGGGATIIKREVFEKIGFFDERYFMYFEDVDFSMRAKAAGFTFAVEPKVLVKHGLEIHKKTKNWRKMSFVLKANLIFIIHRIPWRYKSTAFLYWLMTFTKINFEKFLYTISKTLSNHPQV